MNHLKTRCIKNSFILLVALLFSLPLISFAAGDTPIVFNFYEPDGLAGDGYFKFGQSVSAAGDVNNGDDDVLITNSSNGKNTIWVMQNSARSSQSFLKLMSPSAGYGVAALGDYDGDGDADIFWRNSSNGQNRFWEMENNVRVNQHYPQGATATLSVVK